VFGLGGDPRLGLLLIEERDKIRRDFFHPQIERRKNLKFLKKIVAQKNHDIANEVRRSLNAFHQLAITPQ